MELHDAIGLTRNRFRSWLLLAEDALHRKFFAASVGMAPSDYRCAPLTSSDADKPAKYPDCLESAAEKADRIGGTSPPRFGWPRTEGAARDHGPPAGMRSASVAAATPCSIRDEGSRAQRGRMRVSAPGEPVETSVLARTQRRATDRGPLIRRCAPPSPGGGRPREAADDRLIERHPVRSLVILVAVVATIWLIFAVWPPGFEAVVGKKKVFLSAVFNGVTLGGLYFLVASGFTLIFGLMRNVNLAHGSIYLLRGLCRL